METKEIEFAKLRHAYITVKNFIESKSVIDVKSLDSKIVEDLSLNGDDNCELLEEFVDRFELEYNNFDYSEHFHSEEELYDSGAAFINLMILSVWLPMKTIELLTLNKLNFSKPNFYEPSRIVSDLTFRELLIWYIEKDYKKTGTIKYKITNS